MVITIIILSITLLLCLRGQSELSEEVKDKEEDIKHLEIENVKLKEQLKNKRNEKSN